MIPIYNRSVPKFRACAVCYHRTNKPYICSECHYALPESLVEELYDRSKGAIAKAQKLRKHAIKPA